MVRSFHVLFGHLYVFFGEMSIRSSAQFLTELFVVLILSYMSCFEGEFFSFCVGFSSCGSVVGLMWAQVGSVVAVHRLSCCTACGIPGSRPAIEPLSPALEGGFLTTGPPGKLPVV